MNGQKHKWKTKDDIVAFYLFKSGSKLEIDIAAKKLGIKVTSINRQQKVD